MADRASQNSVFTTCCQYCLRQQAHLFKTGVITHGNHTACLMGPMARDKIQTQSPILPTTLLNTWTKRKSKLNNSPYACRRGVSGLYYCDKDHDQSNWQRKEWVSSYTSREQSITRKVPGRNSRQKSRGRNCSRSHRGVLLPDSPALLPCTIHSQLLRGGSTPRELCPERSIISHGNAHRLACRPNRGRHSLH